MNNLNLGIMRIGKENSWMECLIWRYFGVKQDHLTFILK